MKPEGCTPKKGYSLFCLIGNCVALPIKQKALRENRTAAERNLSLRDPPQAENPALQDSIFMLSPKILLDIFWRNVYFGNTLQM